MSESDAAAQLLWDGDCGFCRSWVESVQEQLSGLVRFSTYQSVSEDIDLPEAELAAAVHLIESDGTVHRGAAAILAALSLGGTRRGRLLWGIYQALPPVRWCAEAVYRVVASHRGLFGRLLGFVEMLDEGGRRHHHLGTITARLLGLVYAIAFVSLWVQLDGIWGSSGIYSAAQYLADIQNRIGESAYWRLPTLFWLHSSDVVLHLVTAVGTIAGLAAAAGIRLRFTVFCAWMIYLSWVSAGGPFLSFQWDALLLEAGALVWLFLCSPRPAIRYVGVWMLRFLVFRVMFASGAAKLTSDDPHWMTFTALEYHFQTQPLPNLVAWWMHHLPKPILQAATGVVFVFELAVPWLIFCGRRLRVVAAVLLLLLQLAFAVTGNFGFFNFLTAVLILSLLHDGVLQRLRPNWNWSPPPSTNAFAGLWRKLLSVGLAVALILAALPGLADRVQVEWEFGRDWSRLVAPWRLVNGYGLFAVMTTRRSEIVLEGTDAEGRWQAVDFRYKPDDTEEAPIWLPLHMPRLDWQLWFAALSGPQRHPWLLGWLKGHCEGSEAVADLVHNVPFGSRPQALRLIRKEYRFTTPRQRRSSGAWWRHGTPKVYLGPVRCERLRSPNH